MTRIKELPNSMNSPLTRIVLPPPTTGKEITRADTSIPSRQWNTLIKLLSGRKKRIGSPQSQWEIHNGAWIDEGVGPLMKRRKPTASPLGGFFSGASLGGKVSHYRDKENIDKQGTPAYGYPLRTSTAVALTASSIRTINKHKMLQLLRKKNKTSNSLVAYLLSSVKNYQDHGVPDYTSSGA